MYIFYYCDTEKLKSISQFSIKAKDLSEKGVNVNIYVLKIK